MVFFLCFFGAITPNQWGIVEYFWASVSWIILVVTFIDIPKRPRSIVGFVAYWISFLSMFVLLGEKMLPFETRMFILVFLGALFVYGLIFMIVPFKNKGLEVTNN